MQDGSEFGCALRDVLQDALPIVRSDLIPAVSCECLEETERGRCTQQQSFTSDLAGLASVACGHGVEPQWTRNTFCSEASRM